MSKDFMYTNRSSSNQRRQRETEQVELRRVKNEEILKRKRDSAQSEQISSFLESKKKLMSNNLTEIYEGAYEFRIGLSIETNPPIQAVIDSGVIPRCVQLLSPQFYSELDELSTNIRVEAAWVLTNICTGTSAQTGEVVENGAIQHLVRMIGEDSPSIVDQAVWCLGNISGDCEAFRDIILNVGGLSLVLRQIMNFQNDELNIKILRNLVWLLANLNRGRNPPPAKDSMKDSFAAIESLISSNDPEIISDCFWGISYICDVDQEMTSKVIKSNVMKRCYDLLEGLDKQLTHGGVSNTAKICSYAICPIIRVIGNIVSGTEEQTQYIIDFGFLAFFNTIFYKYENKKIPRIRKEICWALSNISAGTAGQVKYLFDRDLVPLLIDSISGRELYIRKEAIYGLLNISYFCIANTQYLQSLLDNRIHIALRNYLEASQNNTEVQVQILDTCKYLLEAGNKVMISIGENPVVERMIDEKLADIIEGLQDSRSGNVSKRAYSLVMDFFEGEEEE